MENLLPAIGNHNIMREPSFAYCALNLLASLEYSDINSISKFAQL